MTDGSKKTILIVSGSAALLVFVIVLIVWYLRMTVPTKQPVTQTPPEQSTNTGEFPERVMPPTPPEPDVVYAYSGPITAIDKEKNLLTVKTLWGDRQVHITAQTQITSQSRRLRQIFSDLPPQEAVKAMDVYAPYDKELQVGNQIRADSTAAVTVNTPLEAWRVVYLYTTATP